MNPIFIGSARISLLGLGDVQASSSLLPKAWNACFCLDLPGRARHSSFLSPIFLSPIDLAAASLAVCGGLWLRYLDVAAALAFLPFSPIPSVGNIHTCLLELSLSSMEDGLLDSHLYCSVLQTVGPICGLQSKFRILREKKSDSITTVGIVSWNLFQDSYMQNVWALFKNLESQDYKLTSNPHEDRGIFRWENVIVFKFLLAGLVTERPWGLVGKTSALESKLGQYCYFLTSCVTLDNWRDLSKPP